MQSQVGMPAVTPNVTLSAEGPTLGSRGCWYIKTQKTGFVPYVQGALWVLAGRQMAQSLVDRSYAWPSPSYYLVITVT